MVHKIVVSVPWQLELCSPGRLAVLVAARWAITNLFIFNG